MSSLLTFWDVEENMDNVTISLKSSISYSVEGIVDQGVPVKIAPGMSVSLKLAPGKHTLRVSIPYQGNAVGTVEVAFTVKPDRQYAIFYKFVAFQMRGILTVKEKDGEDQEEVAKASGCITRQGIGVQITWIAGILLLLITMLWFLFF